MAFSLQTFIQNSSTAIFTSVSSRVRNVVEGSREILINTPRRVINNNLERLSGINLKNTFINIGSKVESEITSLVTGLRTQLEAQIVGCINKAINDFLRQNPIVTRILLFDQFILGELGRLRNKVRNKIDLELRKIAYQKIKIYQVALLKQRIAGSIKKLCPDATPATPGQVEEFKQILSNLNESGQEIQDKDPTRTINSNELNNKPSTNGIEQVSDSSKPISNTVLKKLKEDPQEFDRLKNEITDEASKSLIAESRRQTNSSLSQNWEEYYG